MKKKGDFKIPRPVFSTQDKPWMVEKRKGTFEDGNSAALDGRYLLKVKAFKKSIQYYWDTKHLYYLDKWLHKTPDELEKATKDKSLCVAECMIVNFLRVAVQSPHPTLLKMIMEISANMGNNPDYKEESRQHAQSIKRVVLQLPESGRVKK